MLATIVGVLALLATACGGSSSVATTEVPEDTASENTGASGADDVAEQGGSDDTASAPDTGAAESDGTDSTASDTSGLIILDPDQDPRADLSSATASVSGQWPTDWSRRTIDVTELLPGLRGSDPRDGIPPIDEPNFESVSEAGEWLADNEPGALVRLDGEARFYPLSIMTAHEIVNDEFGDVPVAVTFCPLCNTAIAYDRRVDGQVLRFGVSGLLRNSDLVMWDDATTSLWQQISGEGVVGTYAGTQLEAVSTAIVSYAQFRDSFPDGMSLSRDTGFGRSYGLNPYVGYSSLQQPFLFDKEPDPRLPALSRVVAIAEEFGTKAYPFADLQAAGALNDELNGEPVAIFWAPGTADALDASSIADSADIGSAVAYAPIVDGDVLTFTANGDGTFSDDQTGSTWSITGQATAGDFQGTELDTVVHRNEFWFAFAGFFPDAAVYGL